MLDDRVDALNAKFSDLQAAVRYDVGKLENKVGNVPKFGKGDQCLDVRGALVRCYKEQEKGDVRKCDGIMDAMERCVKQAVIA